MALNACLAPSRLLASRCLLNLRSISTSFATCSDQVGLDRNTRETSHGGASSSSPDSTFADNSTDFGYSRVPKEDKSRRVSQVFSSVARSYDVMNDLMSFGLHHLWKTWFVDKLRPFAGQQHLDVAGGTGDIAFKVLDRIQAAEATAGRMGHKDAAAEGRVVVLDINPDMLSEGRRRAEARGLTDDRKLTWIVGDAEKLPFEDNSFDSYTIAFGIRNVTNRDAALREAYRVLRPGGRFLCLEFSQVQEPVLRTVYDAYSFHVIPQIGQMVANDASSYQYLVESIRVFPKQEDFARSVQEAGFSKVGFENYTHGVVAVHSGFKLS